MKGLKKISFILLAALVTLSLFSCGGCKHPDADKDGVCDECGEEIIYTPKDVTLIDNEGNPKFQFVLASNIDSKIKMSIQALIADLEDVDIEVDIVDDKADTAQDCEVLIGDIKSRGKIYSFDGHDCGDKGYAIKIVDGKIIITAGSVDAYSEAVDVFIEDILEFDGDEIWDVTMKVDQQVDETQSEYSITSLKLLGEDMKGYTIAVDKSSNYFFATAKNMQNIIYRQTGYWFDIVDLAEADKSIVLKQIDRVYGEDSYKITASGTQLLIECAFENKIADTTSSFLTTTFVNGEGDINFEGTVFKKDVSFVTYEEFGATNNGKKDNDFEAIYLAHVFANECGQKVIISGSPTYYISYTRYQDKAVYVPIQTDTNWGNAKFIIDDSVIELHGDAKFTVDQHKAMAGLMIFRAVTSKPDLSLSGSRLEGLSFGPGTKNIDLGIDEEIFIRPTYEGHRVYRRKGYRNKGYWGGVQSEVILLDKDGNVSEETPIMWNYEKVSYVLVHFVDQEELTIEGGTFTTIACDDHMMSADGVLRDNYYARGLQIMRSNTIVKNVKHYIEGEITLKEQYEEGKLGVAYNGFFNVNFASHVTLKDCVLSGRRCFTKTAAVGGGGTTGSYDFAAGYVNKIVLDGCIQQNFWVTIGEDGVCTPANADTPNSIVSMAKAKDFGNVLMHWGIGGTNWCKNMEYINSTLSRFDAHMGLYNGKVIGSTVNILALTGMGDMIIENSTLYSLDPSPTYNTILHLRGDYGSTWDGNIKIKDFNAYLYNNVSGNPYIVMSSYANWNFGYICAFPSIEMDNVVFYDAEKFYEDKSRTPYEEGDTVYLHTGNHIEENPSLHLEELAPSTPEKYRPLQWYVDFDGDGYVDGYDRNGDGVVGEGDMPYDDTNTDAYADGIADTNSWKNFNPIKPPVHIKVLNNKGADTDGDGIGDSGAIRLSVNRSDDDGVANGGFFGNTKFYYAPDKYYTGTPEDTLPEDNSFYFNAG